MQGRVNTDKKFAEALLREGIDALLGGDVDTGKTILRDYIRRRSALKLKSLVKQPARLRRV